MQTPERQVSRSHQRRFPKRKWNIVSYGVLALLLWAGHKRFFHLPRDRGARPVSDVFRQYLADRDARLVVYSPSSAAGGAIASATVERQLAMLRQKFNGLVLYDCDSSTAMILNTAEHLGYRAVLLTVWNPASPAELRMAASLVDRYQAHLALAVSIGSEGLMEGRYSLAQIVGARAELQRTSGGTLEVETTTTEPWWLYRRDGPESVALRGFGEFLTANIHVIWDTDIADPTQAAQWSGDRALELAATAGRPVLIRELGLPGGGESPRPSAHIRFTRQDQAAFWRAWMLRRHAPGLPPLPPAVAFEGIDNEDKRWASFESTWGFLSPQLAPYPVWNSFPSLPLHRLPSFR